MAFERWVVKKTIYSIVFAGLMALFLGAPASPAKAFADPVGAAARPIISAYYMHNFYEMRRWFKKQLMTGVLLPAMQLMTEQMVAAGMQETLMVGAFFDAKEQLEAQRDMQRLQALAHKQYQPSRDFCAFGTNVRSLAASDALIPVNRLAMVKRSMSRHLGNVNSSGSGGEVQDKNARWAQFKANYCDPRDKNWRGANTGLSAICGAGASGGERVNRDVDYTRFIEEPRTLGDVNFTDTQTRAQEEDIFALSANLYGHNTKIQTTDDSKGFLGWRATQAKRNIAENSFQNIVALKSAGSEDSQKTSMYLGALVKALGVPPEEILELIGKNPSYFAQLELLAKKIVQSPSFYANLYDKPVNVERTSVALRGVELMVDRAIYESRLRQEMLASTLLSTRLEKPFETARGLADGL